MHRFSGEEPANKPVYELTIPWPVDADQPFKRMAVSGFQKVSGDNSRHNQVENAFNASDGEFELRRMRGEELKELEHLAKYVTESGLTVQYLPVPSEQVRQLLANQG